MNALYILWLRQIKVYSRQWTRIVGAVGQALFFLLALGFGLGPIYTEARKEDYLQFLVPGIIAMTILFLSVFSGMDVIWDRQFGFLKESLVAPVSRYQIMLGRTLGAATVAVIQGLIILGISYLLGFIVYNPALIPVATFFMFLTALLFTSMGTAVAAVLEDMQGFQLIISLIVIPVFFLSGAIFPLEGIPESLQIVAAVNPLSYGVDSLRGTLINQSFFGLQTDLAVLIILTAFFIYLGGVLFSRMQI
ncbi:MAG TPA: ABC transporter permease [Patescibacteria group bacterium]|nr:ABC transporter permease [Patescibacteria group bacterium]